MSEENLRHHFGFIIELWEDTVDFKELHEDQVFLVPEIGDLTDPQKWKGST